MFWPPFGNRYTHAGEGLCQISHFIPEVNDFRLSSSTIYIQKSFTTSKTVYIYAFCFVSFRNNSGQN